jgi:hypothetical protein
MKAALIITVSLLVSAFVALFHPNEYAWMRDETGSGQLPEDADMMFKFGSVMILHALVQAVAIFMLVRSGRKLLAIGLAAAAAAAALLLLQRL